MIYLISNKLFTSPNIQKASFEDFFKRFGDSKIIQCDTETQGFDPHTKDCLTIQLGNQKDQFVFDLTTTKTKERLKEFFNDDDRLFLFHNAKFDLQFLRKLGLFPKRIYDTFLVECILTSGLDNRKLGLADLTKKYLDVELDKSIRGDIHRWGLTDAVIEYAANDVKYLEPIRDKQLAQIEELGLQNVVDLENEVVKVFAHMEYNGVRVNAKDWKELTKEIDSYVADYQVDLDTFVRKEPKLSKYVPEYVQGDLFGHVARDITINWGSPKQKLEILNTLGLKITSVAEKDLMDNRHRHPIVPKLLDYSKKYKLKSSFGENFLSLINSKTKRIHPTYWQILKTGRISVKDPNVNTIPSKGELGKKIRSYFIPADGCKIVGGDYSGMELRIIAEISQDPLWLKVFREGGDLHSVLCAETFDIPIEDVRNPFPPKPEMTYRDVQKTINFGLAYGMSEFKLAATIQISVEEARKVIDKFFAKVPAVENALNGLGLLAVRHGRIRTMQPYGRIRFFTEQLEKAQHNFKYYGEVERAAKNAPIQGTNGDIIKLALVKVQEEIDTYNWPVKILLSVYDEIQTECRVDCAEEWELILNELMVEAAKSVIKTVPVVVDSKVAEFWEK